MPFSNKKGKLDSITYYGILCKLARIVYYGCVIRILPIIFLIILAVGGLVYWRFFVIKSNSPSLTTSQTDIEPVEVPKQLPNATLEERVQVVEKALTEVIKKVNAASGQTDSSLNARVSAVEASITDLKVQIANLPTASSAPSASSSKSTIYIPLGSGGSVASVDWTPLNTFQITLDPSQYPGYTSMQLEVNMRLVQPGGTLYARLYNNSSSSVTSSELSSTSTNSSVYTSSTFTLPSGSKTYVLQAKTSDGSQAFLDTARIRVNF